MTPRGSILFSLESLPVLIAVKGQGVSVGETGMRESGRVALEFSWKPGGHPFPHQPLDSPSVGGI